MSRKPNSPAHGSRGTWLIAKSMRIGLRGGVGIPFMKLLVASDIVRSIGAQSDFMITEILRTGACHREWQRALAFAADDGALDLTRLDELPPRIRRLIDLLSVADELAPSYCDIGIHPAQNAPFASAA